jgi:uncharacterized protein YdeI (YjbR/CyaY-like superfamily)
MPEPTHFASPAAFRAWLARNHETAKELWVGFHKKASGTPSITWPESVDEALCYGWIDGIRKSLGPTSYMIRFTPRRPGSIWSTVNTKRARELMRLGRMRAAGRAAFERRSEARTSIYAYEQRGQELSGAYARRFKANAAAWKFFQAQPPGYRRVVSWWVVSAKKEETRLKRLEQLIADSAAGRRIGLLEKSPRSK